MIKDKKNSSNLINLILLKKIGLKIINGQFTLKSIKSFLRQELMN